MSFVGVSRQPSLFEDDAPAKPIRVLLTGLQLERNRRFGGGWLSSYGTDVTLPTTDGRTLRVRCVVRPDQAQSILLNHLSLDLPRCLHPPQGLSTF